MKTIHKYHLNRNSKNGIDLPKGAKILTVDAQDDRIYLWAEVSLDEQSESRKFLLFGTGDRLPDNQIIEYISTVFMAGGALVWHAYELISEANAN